MIITDISKLKIKCEDASPEETDNIIKLLETELEDCNKKGNYGIGLAAPQIGIYKKVAIVRIGDIKVNLVNSKILDRKLPIQTEEGCLSLPGIKSKIERYNDILVCNNYKFSEKSIVVPNEFVAFGISAICIQHEMDHWDGVLISDISIVKHNNIQQKVGPNDKCLCGSNKKFKKCCGGSV